MPEQKKTLGLVLSGGGARGIAHLGLLKALEKMGGRPQRISGTSAGALIGAFYCAGFSVEEIRSIILDNKFFKWYDFAFSKKGILKISSNEKMLRKYLRDRTFRSLQVPLSVSAVDVQSGEVVVMDSGDLVSALLASSAIPVLFEPVKRMGRSLIDGSAGDCLPVAAIAGKTDVLIGSYVNPVIKTKKQMDMLEVFDRGFHLALRHEVEAKRPEFDLLLEPPQLVNYSMFDFKKGEEILDAGCAFAMRNKDKILTLLDSNGD